jgi:hypothetical protein
MPRGGQKPKPDHPWILRMIVPRLKSMLRRLLMYAPNHALNCPALYSSVKCTCGLDALLLEIKEFVK